MRLPRSTIARFTALAFLFQFLVTCAAVLFVQEASQRVLAAEERDLVTELRDELKLAYNAGGLPELQRVIRERLGAVEGGNVVILLASPEGRRIAGNIGGWPPVLPDSASWRAIELYRIGAEAPEPMGVATLRLPGGERLLAGRVITSVTRLKAVNGDTLAAALLVGAALAIVSALGIGRLLSRRLKTIAATASAVEGGAFAQRVRITGSDDAFDSLSRAINAMLDRIEALVSQLRMMTDGLAHDLRSPVTRMKSVLESAILEVRDPISLGALERVSVEAETLLSMLTTALVISRAEAGIGRDHFMDTDVSSLLCDLAEIYGPVAEEQGFVIEVREDAPLRAALHRELISQAIGNLIENALKYAEGGSRIVLSGAREEHTMRIDVADDGPGIQVQDRERALRRFGRLDPARHVAGFGLGLSLVEAVARLHGGALSLEDNAPGLRAVLRLDV
ncbi:sensor histidine kinase [Sphingosinicella microcystinivorans]|uniref:histidine kinase n=1 Tax=Sphingosinicella microcystinivorans TaxID=335406 RepID=A0AAD1G0V3_SPHMI|nr:ATP-binding protein [Sphingosinicella microcystinivorans]RKS91200.1 signal transduction histidine kinase [Sphingosinicella microcystinivorans]BBE34168.1 two-component sensor histidine kinase [Sphingosinicella microcystinivorans]